MKAIPPRLRAELDCDPYYKKCSRKAYFNDHECAPNPLNGQLIEWEHAFVHGGHQVQERWAIIPICYYSHRGGGLDKEKNQYIALRRATLGELTKYPKTNWYQLFTYLHSKFG